MRKGQVNPQNYISLLIFVIGVAIIMYILFLPPEDRAQLLEQNRTALGFEDEKDKITILMEKEPGRIENIPDTEIVKDLPSFNLFIRTEPSILVDFDSIFIKKSLFEEQSRNISFKISEFENTNNYVLSFNAPQREGILTVFLNNNILLSRKIETASPGPIKLPVDWLSKDNTLLFRVSGPGIEFWKSNQYQITDMKITAEITDRSGQENKQIILVTEQEKNNLESLQLGFIVDCKTTDVSPLQVFFNKRLIYSSIPTCGDPVDVPPVDERRVREGENDLLFRMDKGFYEIYGLDTTLTLKEPLFPTYFFTLDQETFDAIEADRADINVTVRFTNKEDRKKGTILVNEFITEIETFDNFFSRNIDHFVKEGNNAIEIRPKDEKLDILELRVLLAE